MPLPANKPKHKHPCPWPNCLDKHGQQRMFRSPFDVAQHERGDHLGEAGKIFQCGMCPRKFARAAVRSTHEENVHGIVLNRPGKGGNKKREVTADQAPANRRRKSKAGQTPAAPNAGMATQLPLPAFMPPSQNPQAFPDAFKMPQQYGEQMTLGQLPLTQQTSEDVGQSYGSTNQGTDDASQPTSQSHGLRDQSHSHEQHSPPVSQERMTSFEPEFFACNRVQGGPFTSVDPVAFVVYTHEVHGAPVRDDCDCSYCNAIRGVSLSHLNQQLTDENVSVGPAVQQAADYENDSSLLTAEHDPNTDSAPQQLTDSEWCEQDTVEGHLAADLREQGASEEIAGDFGHDLSQATVQDNASADPAAQELTDFEQFEKQMAAGRLTTMDADSGEQTVVEYLKFDEELISEGNAEFRPTLGYEPAHVTPAPSLACAVEAQSGGGVYGRDVVEELLDKL